MKKVILSTVIIAAAMLASCGAKGGANLKTDIDSLSYAVGMTHTQGLAPYLMQLGVDTTAMGDFLRGVKEGNSVDPEDAKRKAYMIGLQVGQQVGDMFESANQQMFQGDTLVGLDKNNYLAGFMAGASGKNMKMNVDSAAMYSEAKARAIREKSLEDEFGANRTANVEFLEANKANEGVVTLPSGLQYKVITEGKGAIPTTSDMVKVHYTGTLIDGTKFDSSVDRGEPATFGTTQVIPGWTEALTMMPVGSKWMLYIPQEMAYGSDQTPQIPPFSTLVFEVELLDIVK